MEQVNNIDNARKVYLNVIVKCNDKEIPVRALIDTGNTVRARSVMDKKFHEKLIPHVYELLLYEN